MTRGPLDPLARLTIFTIVGLGASYVWLIYATEGEINTFAILGGVFFALVSLLVLTGNWAATAVAAIVAGGVGIQVWVGDTSVLSDPGRDDFWPMWLWVLCTVVTLVAGLAASFRIARARRSTSPDGDGEGI